jgi:hypothetical protein
MTRIFVTISFAVILCNRGNPRSMENYEIRVSKIFNTLAL